MKKYEVIKGCVIKGQGHQTGSIVELEDYEVNQLIAMGRIVEVKEEPKIETNRSIGLDGDKPRKRKQKAKKEEEPSEETPTVPEELISDEAE
jgi:hypothetical protein